MYIKPRAIAIDQTEYWDPKIVEEAGHLFAVYLYDAGVVTHLCEFTPSYYLVPVNYFTDTPYDELSGQTANDIDDANAQDEPIYMHCSHVETFHPTILENSTRCKREEYDEKWEEFVEYYQANTPDVKYVNRKKISPVELASNT